MLERFAGNPGVLRLLGLTGGLAAAAPSVVGFGDLFIGDTTGMNSGEIPLNAVLGLGGVVGAGLGAAAGGATSATGREIARAYMDAATGQENIFDRYLSEKPAKGDSDYRDYVLRKQAMRQEQRGMARAMGVENYQYVPMDRIVGRALGRTGTGALLGTAIATPLSIMAMMDQGKAQPHNPQPLELE